MGMFDYVNTPDIECPECKEKLFDFQTKDKLCLLETVDYTEVDNFYTHCGSCKTWVEFKKDDGDDRDIKGYTMSIESRYKGLNPNKHSRMS